MSFYLRHPILTARAVWSLWRDPPGAVFLLSLPTKDEFAAMREDRPNPNAQSSS